MQSRIKSGFIDFYCFAQFSPIKNVLNQSVKVVISFSFSSSLVNLEQLLAIPVAKQQNASFQCFLVERGTTIFYLARGEDKSLFAQGILIFVSFGQLVSALAEVTGKQRHLTAELPAVCKTQAVSGST